MGHKQFKKILISKTGRIPPNMQTSDYLCTFRKYCVRFADMGSEYGEMETGQERISGYGGMGNMRFRDRGELIQGQGT